MIARTTHHEAGKSDDELFEQLAAAGGGATTRPTTTPLRAVAGHHQYSLCALVNGDPLDGSTPVP